MSTIKLKRSGESGSAPGPDDLVHGELAVNYADNKLYTLGHGGSVIDLLEVGERVGVSAWNGQSGMVVFNDYVSSFNGLSGAVQGVSGWNGATGQVVFNDYVSSFNGSSGDVTTCGVTTCVGGVTLGGGGATFGGNIVLQNSDYISNPSAYTVRMMPEGTSATDYGLEFEFSDWGYGSVITSRKASDLSNGGNIRFDTAFGSANDIDLNMGSSAHSRFRYSTNGYNTLQVGVQCSAAAGGAGAFALINTNHMGQSYRLPGVTHGNPNFYVYASSGDADDYIRIEHDATDANIVTGAGDISLQPSSGVVGVSGSVDVSGSLTVAGGATGDVLMVNNDGDLEFESFKTTATFIVDSDVPLTTGIRYKGLYAVPLAKMDVTNIDLRSHDVSPAGSGDSLSVALKTIRRALSLEAASPAIQGTVETIAIPLGGEYHHSVAEANVDTPGVGSSNLGSYLVVDVVSNAGNHTNFTMLVTLEARP